MITIDRIVTALCLSAMLAAVYGYYSGELLPAQIIVGILVAPLALASVTISFFLMLSLVLRLISTIYTFMALPGNQRFRTFAFDFNDFLDPSLFVICSVTIAGIYFILSLVQIF